MAESRAIRRVLRNMEDIKLQVATFGETTPLHDLEATRALLTDQWNEFQTVERGLKGKFDEANIESVEKIERLQYDLKRKLFVLEKACEEMNNNPNNNTIDELVLNQTNFLQEVANLNKRESEVRLPHINIPNFDGKYSEFPSFRDLFEASIHKRSAISKVHKLQYLKGLLKGEAFALINHLSTTDANYDEAWEKVKMRYDKPKHVVHSLLRQFMEQPILQQSCSKSLRKLCDTSDEVVRGLKVLGADAETRDPWLIYILANKLDNDSKQAWAHETTEINFPSLQLFFKFLNKRSDALESLNSLQRNKINHPKKTTALVSQIQTSCPLCSDDHYLGKCEKFIELPVPERRAMVANKKLCFNCLSASHQAIVCRSRVNCGKCRRRHHVTLHTEINDTKVEQTESKNFNILMQSSNSEQGQAILPTASVIIKDQYGRSHKCRALLDCGSQSSFISEDCVQRLRLMRNSANVNIKGITATAIKARGRSTLTMGSIHNPEICIEVSALILNKLPQRMPVYHINSEEIEQEDNIQLADPDFKQPAPIDILIGADKFFAILDEGRKRLGSTILQNTIFGWVVSGQPNSLNISDSTTHMISTIQYDKDIDKTLRQFWEMEDVPQTSELTPEDQECEAFYNKTVKRREDGRYIVKLPFRTSSAELGNSLLGATRRFLALERKLWNDEPRRKRYTEQMREYIESGHMVEIPQNQRNSREEETFYLPHHALEKESSETTKMRVVFDGSAKTTKGISLNDILMVGPSIQPPLWVTLMRFRNNRIALTADIEKMYRQVVVSPEDTNYQRLLLRENPSQQIRHFKLTRVMFGLACSAYLAIRTLQKLAYDFGDKVMARHILSDFYVDDFLSGAENVKDATEIKRKITAILRSGGFALRKWRSNSLDLCDEPSEGDTAKLYDEINSTVVVLGLLWRPSDDIFTFKVHPENEGPITKRKLLSEASRVFDPLGFLSPSIILLKILFQRTWLLKIDWNDILHDNHITEYKRVREEFKWFQEIKIPRFCNHYENSQIHGFADASETAYCAVIYSRTINENGEIIINLLTSKTKVAPVKKISLPRLELCAAHLLAKLMSAVKKINKSTAKYYAWTDSTIVLAWLSTYPAKWKTFIANRTSQILEQFPRQHWSYVKSAENPADHGTRGVSPLKLTQLKQWWEGPEWLRSPEFLWPKTTNLNAKLIESAIEKGSSKHTRHALLITTENNCLSNLFARKSNLMKIFRIICYVKRYIANLKCKNRSERATDELNSEEVEATRIQCIRWVQQEKFSEDIASLRKYKTTKANSKIQALAPFIDATGVLRVGGRLFNADCDYDSKHPVIIPAEHVYTERLIWEVHNKNLHAGPTLTNSLIRQRYWVINGRNKIRSMLRKCIICVKYAHKTSRQLMGNLPAERVTPTRPFTNCGIDFAGPLYFASKKGRGSITNKGYLCVFVCLSVKAIHIEPVSDLTSEGFLAALKRFVSRRGVPKKIYSDNGSNFVGARRILKEAYQIMQQISNNRLISEFLSSNNVDWHMIPPSSPHFGGLWESAVKSVKTHLMKLTNNINLTFEEMATLLCQIENVLNSRPLYTTSHGDDYEVLTPAHFLIGTSTGSIPELEITQKDSSLSRWQRIQARIQTFWKKYSVDYLNTLQQRQKWQHAEKDIKINDIVLIREDNTPVCNWPLGRVIEVHPGGDNLVRVVTLKTAHSTLQRPIVKLCKLPVC